jgi:hypothetical protein
LSAAKKIPQDKLIYIKYEELLAAPVDEIKRIYEKFRLSDPPLLEYWIRQHIRDSPFQPSRPDPLPALNPTMKSFLTVLRQHYGYS